MNPTEEQKQEILTHLRTCVNFFKTNMGQFNSFDRLMLDYGVFCDKTPTTYKGRRGEAHQCFANTAHKVLERKNLIYVEGYVWVHGVHIHHAWAIKAKTNEVIDSTLTGDPDSYLCYLGIPFTKEYLTRVIKETGYYGLISYTNPSLFALDMKPEVFLHPDYPMRRS